MATFVGMYDRIHVGHLDLSDADEVSFGPISAVAVPFPSFMAGGFVQFRPGLISGEFNVSAYQDFAADVLDDEIGVSGLGSQYPVSVAPNATATDAAGDPAYFSRGLIGSYDPFGGAKGDAAKANIGMMYDTALIRGVLAVPKAARTASGNGTAIALAGPTATQRLYAALHVFAYSGFTNVVVKVQSDDSGAMSSPTDRITFATVTGTPASEFASVAGSFASETHHRAIWTVTGTGSITFAVYFGVL